MIRSVPARWRGVVLVCAKCEKKVRGGFGENGRTPLSKLLRKIAGKGRKAEFGVAPVKCLKICPKRAVTVVSATRPRDWLIVPAGTPVEDVVAALGFENEADQVENKHLTAAR